MMMHANRMISYANMGKNNKTPIETANIIITNNALLAYV